MQIFVWYKIPLLYYPCLWMQSNTGQGSISIHPILSHPLNTIRTSNYPTQWVSQNLLTHYIANVEQLPDGLYMVRKMDLFWVPSINIFPSNKMVANQLLFAQFEMYQVNIYQKVV